MRKLTLTFGILFTLQLNAQTALCNNNAAGEIVPGSTCTYEIWDSGDNNNYWTSAATNGVCNEGNFDDVWAWFTAVNTTTTINYDPLTAGADPIVTVFEGACNASGTSVACSDLAAANGIETITMSTIPGTVYHIRIQNYNSNATMLGDLCVVGTTGSGATTASDCNVAVNVCTNLSFQIDPNGSGIVADIPAIGSTGNPSTNPFSLNQGCLLNGEYNSTWMIVNIATTGSLEFVIGGNGTQAGYYDWIMYPYTGPGTCASIASNGVAPVRCNWNASSAGGTGLSTPVPGGGNAGNYEPPLAVTAGQQYVICFSNWSSASTSVPLEFLTDPGNASVSCTPLGFELQDMLVTCDESYRTIEWILPEQNAVSKMTVQKSRDASSWEDLAEFTHAPADENGFMHFKFGDDQDVNTLAYYRIRQDMQDGSVKWTNTVSADCDNKNNPFDVYPNPANNKLTLEYKSLDATALEFYTLTGERVYNVDLPRAEKRTKATIDTETVINGVYILKMKLNDEVYTAKVVIAH